MTVARTGCPDGELERLGGANEFLERRSAMTRRTGWR